MWIERGLQKRRDRKISRALEQWNKIKTADGFLIVCTRRPPSPPPLGKNMLSKLRASTCWKQEKIEILAPKESGGGVLMIFLQYTAGPEKEEIPIHKLSWPTSEVGAQGKVECATGTTPGQVKPKQAGCFWELTPDELREPTTQGYQLSTIAKGWMKNQWGQIRFPKPITWELLKSTSAILKLWITVYSEIC